jgi:hypothetical protein
VCGGSGGQCFYEKLETYSDELTDRVECHCITDCEMTHFFSRWALSRIDVAINNFKTCPTAFDE